MIDTELWSFIPEKETLNKIRNKTIDISVLGLDKLEMKIMDLIERLNSEKLKHKINHYILIPIMILSFKLEKLKKR